MAAHSPVECRLCHQAKEGNLNCSRPPRPKTRPTEKNRNTDLGLASPLPSSKASNSLPTSYSLPSNVILSPLLFVTPLSIIVRSVNRTPAGIFEPLSFLGIFPVRALEIVGTAIVYSCCEICPGVNGAHTSTIRDTTLGLSPVPVLPSDTAV